MHNYIVGVGIIEYFTQVQKIEKLYVSLFNCGTIYDQYLWWHFILKDAALSGKCFTFICLFETVFGHNYRFPTFLH